jgi:methionine synthase II (cobalamin-independent)
LRSHLLLPVPFTLRSVTPCRLATSVARPETQVVTHLCYSDFEDILPAIDGLKGALL